ncbi:MAG: hypothetical protein RI885_597 [Actinomycetota bacterium]
MEQLPSPREHTLTVVTGVILTLGVFYFIGELAAAALWQAGPYSFRFDYISDLGAVVCRDAAESPARAADAGTGGRAVCSPGNLFMNGAFVLQGVVTAVGGLLATHLLLPHRAVRWVVTVLLLVSAIGSVMVGIFPGSFGMPPTGLNRLHWLGAAMAILGGNLGIVVFGISALWRGPRIWAVFAIVAGTVGLVALFCFRSPVERMLGSGLLERLAVDPIIVWVIATGVMLLVRSRRHARGARAM